MGGKSSPPQAPDPYQSAQAQYQFGTQAAAYSKGLNAPNTIGPSGSTEQVFTGYDQASGAPQYTTVSQLSPQQQAIYDVTQANQLTTGQTAGNVAQQVAGTLARPLPTNPQAPTLDTSLAAPTLQTTGLATPTLQGQIDTSQIPRIPGASDLAGFTQQAQDAAYKQQTQYLDPQLSVERQQLDAQLRNSGAQPGSTAYDTAMHAQDLKEQQAYQSAREGAIGQGLQEQQALYGEGANTQQQLFGQATAEQQARNQAAQAGFGMSAQQLQALNAARAAQFGMSEEELQAINAARGQQFGENVTQLQNQIALNQVPLNEYNALEGGVNPQLPSFGLGGNATPATVNAPDIMSAFQNQYQGQLAQYNAGVASQNADMGALAGLASAAIIAASDERVKDDIVRVGDVDDVGTGAYTFRYKGDPEPHLGFIAQDVERHYPETVVELGGVKHIKVRELARALAG